MSRRRTKEGYLHVKQAGRFGKSWKRKWVVAQPNNTRSQVGELAAPSILLELYVEKGAYGKTVNSVLVEGATEVSRVFSKSQALAFEIKKGEETLLAAAGESEAETQEWLSMFKHQLLIIRKKELTKLPDAKEAAYRVSVIPNKYSDSLQLSGDVLAHVTSMTFGLYDLYEGTLIKEWDLRHTKKFALQGKGPQKDVDRIAVIQISNRSPHGAGDLHLYSLNAKPFLEKIYENLNTAMDVKSKRTRSSSMLFEIPPKELEALGKEVKEGSKSATDGTDANGSTRKEDEPAANGPSSKEHSVSSEAQSNEVEKELKETLDDEISFTSEESKEKGETANSAEVKQSEEEKPPVEISVEVSPVEDKPDSPQQDEPAPSSPTDVGEQKTEENKTLSEVLPDAVVDVSSAPQQTNEDKADESEPTDGKEEVVSKDDEVKVEEEKTPKEEPKEEIINEQKDAESSSVSDETPTGDVVEPKEETIDEQKDAEPSSVSEETPTKDVTELIEGKTIEQKDVEVSAVSEETPRENVVEPKEEVTDKQKDAEPPSEETTTADRKQEEKVEQTSDGGNTQEAEVEVHSTDTSSTLETSEDNEGVASEASQERKTGDAPEDAVQVKTPEPIEDEKEDVKDDTEPGCTEEKDALTQQPDVSQEDTVPEEKKEEIQVEVKEITSPEDSEKIDEEAVREGAPSNPQEDDGVSKEDASIEVVQVAEEEESTPVKEGETKPEESEVQIGETPTDDKASGPEAVKMEDDGTQTTFGDDENNGSSNDQSDKLDESKGMDSTTTESVEEGTSIE